jgi:hypothetical protein
LPAFPSDNLDLSNEDNLMKPHARLTFAATLLVCVLPTLAQRLAAPAPAPEPAAKPSDILTDRPDVDPDQSLDLLGPQFESKSQGISLRAPKDAVVVRRVGSENIVEFVNEKQNWSLKVSKLELTAPGSLTEWRDAQGRPQPGVMESTTKRLKEENPDAQVLRQEKITIADGDVGLIALRYTKGLKSVLSQQAIIQRTDQMYYTVSLTTPGAEKGAKEADAITSERLAIETFRQILDSVKLLNRDDIRRDQDERLFRTRALLVNFTPKRLTESMLPKQWARILKNGKDIGYTYFEERTNVKGGQEGIEVRTRSRVLPGKDVQIDVGSIVFSSVDLRHEDWSTLTQTANTKQRVANKEYKAPTITEFGVSDRRVIPGQGDDYDLAVQFEGTGAEGGEPVERELPPFYLPQAISHMLPRLLPLDPRTYMFAVWSPEMRQVMSRYVDVEGPKVYTFNGERLRAYAMKDRLGLEGSETIHYMSSDHVWIGSENKDSGLTIVPSDEKALLERWADADLTRPEAPTPKKANPNAPGKQSPTGSDGAADTGSPKPRNGKTTPPPAKPGQKRRGLDGSAK